MNFHFEFFLSTFHCLLDTDFLPEGTSEPSLVNDLHAEERGRGRRAQSVKKLVKDLGFNPLQDLYGLKSMPTDVRTDFLQTTLFTEELRRRREVDFPQLKGSLLFFSFILFYSFI